MGGAGISEEDDPEKSKAWYCPCPQVALSLAGQASCSSGPGVTGSWRRARSLWARISRASRLEGVGMELAFPGG